MVAASLRASTPAVRGCGWAVVSGAGVTVTTPPAYTPEASRWTMPSRRTSPRTRPGSRASPATSLLSAGDPDDGAERAIRPLHHRCDGDQGAGPRVAHGPALDGEELVGERRRGE